MSTRQLSPVALPSPRPVGLVALLCLLVAGLPLATLPAVAANPDHLVISEVVTGGASASDELIELYNPTAASLPLEGLELIYVSASGATVSRRAAWAVGAPTIGPFAHLLLANEAGVYAAIADALYATGMAATGGSVALRIQGATTAIDAVGWGTATGTWLEGSAAAAPPAGSSIERLPGGASGSGQDTDDNATDFVIRTVPDPQNSGSSPTPHPGASPSETPSPTPSDAGTTPSATATGTPIPTETGTPSSTPTTAPTPSPVTIIDVATARSLPDGTAVTVEGVALTASDFTDGGGYVADATAGIAVLVTDGSFARGELLRIRGALDDRYAQRTIRTTGADILPLGTADPPSSRSTLTGAVGEAVEGSLVLVSGAVVSGPTVLTSGPAYDIDDGSGPVRVLVATVTGIDAGAWDIGTSLELVAVVGQRDSSGTGQAGYRLQPRDPDDILSVIAPASPSASASPSGTASPTSNPSPSAPAAPGTISIADAREAGRNARVTVRGVVTLPTGIVDEGTAVIQDATGAIVLRLGDDAGSLSRGRLVDVSGARSTKSGMETIRVTVPPTDRGSTAEPGPLATRTGEVGEALEASLVVVRGAVAAPRRAGSGTVSFDVDDGSGPLRVVATAATGFDEELSAGDWVEVVGVVGQETTGAQPLRGYRLWPRQATDIRVTASTTAGSGPASSAANSDGSTSEPGRGSDPAMLGAIGPGGAVPGDLEIGATLVATAWPELAISGLLWDGERLVAIDARAAAAIGRSIASVTPPLALRLTALEAIGVDEATGIGVVTTHAERVSAGGRLVPPATTLPAPGEAPRWVSLVGRLSGEAGRPSALAVTGAGRIALSPACGAGLRLGEGAGQVAVTGIGLAAPARIVVGCGGIRRAPALSGRPGAASATSPEQAVLAGSSVAAPLSPVAQDRRLTASLALVVGLFMVVAATLARALERRRGTEPPVGDDAADGADPDEGRDDDDALAGGATTRVPTLTLVAVPRERGP